MIDVVQALEMFEICADEIAAEEAGDWSHAGGADHRHLTLTARALAKRHLDVAHLTRFPIRGSLCDANGAGEPTMTLGALIVFRTADRFVRAGASTAHTLDALYRAVQRYLDIIPVSLQDRIDTTAVGLVLAEAGQSSRLPRRVPSPAASHGAA
jgi:hypothetical protein